MRFATSFFLLPLLLVSASGVNGAETITVGPDGDFPTISAALARMSDGDVCGIAEGVYRETIHVTRNNVTLVGKGRVVITGCDTAGDFQPVTIAGKDGLRTNVDAPVHDVFHRGRVLDLARFPNKTVSMTRNLDWEHTEIRDERTVLFPEVGELPALDDGYYVGLHGANRPYLSSWYSISVPITGLSGKNGLELDASRASSGFMGKYGSGAGVGYVIGARAALDSPGEWYSDGKELLIIPPERGREDYELRTRLYGAVIEGDDARLENIHFLAATMRVEGDGVSIDRCTFEHISPFQHTPNDTPQGKTGQSLSSGWGNPENGTMGVFVTGDRFSAVNCVFSKTWWAGMTIRGSRARVENCLFEDVDWIARRCAGLFSWGDDNVVRYCTLRDLGGAAIEGGNTHWVEQYAKRNVWEYNAIENACKLIVDQGFFYVNHQDGGREKAASVWRYNVGRGAHGPEKGNWKRTCVGYYIDNSSSGYRVHNNIAIDVAEGLRYNDTQDGPKAGRDIRFYNNTLYQCDSPIAFNAWNSRGGKALADADVRLINNLAIPEGSFSVGKWDAQLDWVNNFVAGANVVANAAAGDFTPTDEKLNRSGVPVLGESIPYVGAVDPAKGMWRYGADESKLPRLATPEPE